MSAPPSVLPTSLSTSGYQDGLGRRSLAFDRESGSVLERLVVRPELFAFERSLRQRADHLATFDDERVARVRDIEHDRDTGTLTVVSEFVAGRRMADLLDENSELGLEENAAPSIDQALGLLLQLLPALSALHTVAGVPHGVVGPGRIVITPAGQVVLLDAIYGPSVERLQLSRRRLWTELRVAPAPSAGPCRFDLTADIAQAGLAAAAMTVGRRLGDREYPDGLRALIDETVEIAQLRGSARFATALQRFFERALPLPARRIYATAEEALGAVQELVTAEMGEECCRRALTALVRDAEVAATAVREFEAAPAGPEIVLDIDPSNDPRDDEEPGSIPIDVEQPIALAPEHEESLVGPDPEHPAALAVNIEPSVALAPGVEPIAVVIPPAVAVMADVRPPLAVPSPSDEPIVREPLMEEPVGAAVASVGQVEIPTPLVPEVPVAPVIEPAPRVLGIEEPAIGSVVDEPEPAPVPLAAQAPTLAPPLSRAPADGKRKRSGRKHRDRLRSTDAPAAPQQPVPAAPQQPVSVVHFESPLPVAPPVSVRMPSYDQLPQPGWSPPPPVPAAPMVAAPVAATPVIAVRLKAEAPAGYVPPTMSPRARPGQFNDISAHHAIFARPETQTSSTNRWKLLAAAAVLIAVGVTVNRANLFGRLPEAARPVAATLQPVAAPDPVSTPGGSLVVETQPDGARVLIDGKPAGESPLKVDGIAPGSHIITLITSSATLKRSIKIEAGKTSTLDVPVYSGWLAIYAPIVLDVAENGRTIGTTEHGKLMLPPGRHTLTLSNKDLGYTAVRKVDVESGEERALSIEPRGAISLNAVPWAEVFIDGKRVGETPIAKLEVPLGTREILFKHPQFGERRVTEVVTAIASSAVSVDFSK